MTRSRNGRQQSLVFKYLDTFPKPPGIPDWPQEIPDPTLEQLIEKALAVADRVYALARGSIVLEAKTSEADLPNRLEHAYFGADVSAPLAAR